MTDTDNRYGTRKYAEGKYGHRPDRCRYARVSVAVEDEATRRATLIVCYLGDDTRRATVTVPTLVDVTRRGQISAVVLREPVRRAVMNVAGGVDETRRAKVSVNYTTEDDECYAWQSGSPSGWTNPTNASEAPDGSCTTCSLYHIGGYLKADFNCFASSPNNSSHHVQGIEVEITWATQDAGNKECRVQLFSVSAIGDAKDYSPVPIGICSTAGATKLGGQNDRWGADSPALLDGIAGIRHANFGVKIWNLDGSSATKYVDAVKMRAWWSPWCERTRRAVVTVATGVDDTRKASVTVESDIREDVRRGSVNSAVTKQITRRSKVYVVPPFDKDVTRRSEIRVPYTVDDTRSARVDVAHIHMNESCDDTPGGIGNPWDPGINIFDGYENATCAATSYFSNMSLQNYFSLPGDAVLLGVKAIFNAAEEAGTEEFEVYLYVGGYQLGIAKTGHFAEGTSCSDVRKKILGGISDLWGSSASILGTNPGVQINYGVWSITTKIMDGMKLCYYWVHGADVTRRASVTVATGADDVRRSEVSAAITREETRRARVIHCVVNDETRKCEVLVCYVGDDTRKASVNVATTIEDVRRGTLHIAVTKEPTRRGSMNTAVQVDDVRKAYLTVDTYEYWRQAARRAKVSVAVTKEETRRAVVDVRVATTIDVTRRASLWVVDVVTPKESTRRAKVTPYLTAGIAQERRRAHLHIAVTTEVTRKAQVTVWQLVTTEGITRRSVLAVTADEDITRRASVSPVRENDVTRRANLIHCAVIEDTRRGLLRSAVSTDVTRRSEVTPWQLIISEDEVRRARVYVERYDYTNHETRRSIIYVVRGEDVTRRARVTAAGVGDDTRRSTVTPLFLNESTRRGQVGVARLVDITRRARVTHVVLEDITRQGICRVAVEVQEVRRATLSVTSDADITRRGVVIATAVGDFTRRAHVYVGGHLTRHETRRAQVTVFGKTRPKHVRILFEE